MSPSEIVISEAVSAASEDVASEAGVYVLLDNQSQLIERGARSRFNAKRTRFSVIRSWRRCFTAWCQYRT